MIENTNTKVSYTVTDPESRIFNFPFRFFEPGDLQVWIAHGDEYRSLDYGSSDFAVEYKDNYDSGGNILIAPGILAAGDTLVILRCLPPVQQTNLPQYGKLDSVALEKQLDKFAMICQQLKEMLDRAAVLPPTEINRDALAVFRGLVSDAEDQVRLAGNQAQLAGDRADDARSAQSAAETARDDARSAKSGAEAARDAARSAQSAAEAARADAGTYAAAAETAGAEAGREAGRYIAAQAGAQAGREAAYEAIDEAVSEVARAAGTSAGTSAANTAIAGHNTAADAHSGILAPLASPALTGTPTAPTPGTEDNSQRIATTAFVEARVVAHENDATAHGDLLKKYVPAGAVLPFAGAGNVPAGFLLCNGAAVSRSTYAALFDAIGTTYGEGDGSTTFQLPDFRGRFLRGFLSGTTAAIGTAQAESLPNITGGYLASENKNSFSATSALYSSGTITKSRCGDQDYDGPKVYFKASRCNSIYAGSHVTPVNYAVQWIIKY